MMAVRDRVRSTVDSVPPYVWLGVAVALVVWWSWWNTRRMIKIVRDANRPTWLDYKGPPPDTQFLALDEINPHVRRMTPQQGTNKTALTTQSSPLRDRTYPDIYLGFLPALGGGDG